MESKKVNFFKLLTHDGVDNQILHYM